MAKRVGGLRRKTKSKLKKTLQKRGKISITKYLQTFKEGDRVMLSWEGAVQKGIYHPRFYGKTGVIDRKIGSRCYEVKIWDGGKQKTLIIHPIHLKRL